MSSTFTAGKNIHRQRNGGRTKFLMQAWFEFKLKLLTDRLTLISPGTWRFEGGY